MNIKFRIISLFSLAGPLFGGIALAFIYSPEQSVDLLFLPGKGGALAVLITLVIFYPKALAIGFVPACLTGLAYAQLWQTESIKNSPWPIFFALSGLIGGLFTAAFHGFVWPLLTHDDLPSRWMWLGASGAIASIICAAFVPAVVKSALLK